LGLVCEGLIEEKRAMKDVDKKESVLAKGFEERQVRLGKEENLRRLFNLGSEDILNLSERKKGGGVGFVEIENERKMSKLN
jgi:hypothetical protein